MPPTPLKTLIGPLDEPQLDRLHQAIHGLSSTQLAWASGYLAALARPNVPAKQAPQASVRLTVLYGSQTGNARGVAESLGEQALVQGLDARVLSTGDFRPRDLAKEPLLLLVVSAQG